ncbi:MAG: hypothetical protein SGJ02_01985 [bacterium]|nr:hypothetical protein [bacterium]
MKTILLALLALTFTLKAEAAVPSGCFVTHSNPNTCYQGYSNTFHVFNNYSDYYNFYGPVLGSVLFETSSCQYELQTKSLQYNACVANLNSLQANFQSFQSLANNNIFNDSACFTAYSNLLGNNYFNYNLALDSLAEFAYVQGMTSYAKILKKVCGSKCKHIKLKNFI